MYSLSLRSFYPTNCAPRAPFISYSLFPLFLFILLLSASSIELLIWVPSGEFLSFFGIFSLCLSSTVSYLDVCYFFSYTPKLYLYLGYALFLHYLLGDGFSILLAPASPPIRTLLGSVCHMALLTEVPSGKFFPCTGIFPLCFRSKWTAYTLFITSLRGLRLMCCSVRQSSTW